jgi:hypothetical protein
MRSRVYPLLVEQLLSIFSPAQLRLTLGSPYTATAHPRAQTPKCCSPSPHRCSVPVLGPYHYWIPVPCPCLPSHEFNQLYAMLCQGPIWDPQARKHVTSEKRGIHSFVYGFTPSHVTSSLHGLLVLTRAPFTSPFWYCLFHGGVQIYISTAQPLFPLRRCIYLSSTNIYLKVS